VWIIVFGRSFRPRGCRGMALGHLFGESKVQNLHVPALGNENVLRLDVAMDDAFGVCRDERVRRLRAPIEQGIERQRLSSNALPEGLPF